jgi:hypothetical protein
LSVSSDHQPQQSFFAVIELEFQEAKMGSPADNYWPEACAYCGGDGKLPTGLQNLLEFHGLAVEQLYGMSREAMPACQVCGSKAFVLV